MTAMHWWTFPFSLGQLAGLHEVSRLFGIRGHRKDPKGADKDWASSMRKMKDACARQAENGGRKVTGYLGGILIG